MLSEVCGYPSTTGYKYQELKRLKGKRWIFTTAEREKMEL